MCAVINFGILGIGDSACDATMSWTFFDDKSRKIFKNTLQLDEETLNRARGLALWKGFIASDAHNSTNNAIGEESYRIIDINGRYWEYLS